MALGVQAFPFTIRSVIIPGGSAGAHTTTAGDFFTDDTLLSVVEVTAAGATTDLTAEFSIDGRNSLDNTAGTDTTGDWLVVTYMQPEGA